mgnify:CR=1 FL=1
MTSPNASSDPEYLAKRLQTIRHKRAIKQLELEEKEVMLLAEEAEKKQKKLEEERKQKELEEERKKKELAEKRGDSENDNPNK